MRRTPGQRPKTDDIDKPSIALVLDHYSVRYIHKAGWQKCVCIFHDDTQPSMTVNLDTGGFTCKACNTFGGDALQMVRLKEGCDFPTAVKKLEQITGQSVNTGGGERVERVKRGGFRPRFKA